MKEKNARLTRWSLSLQPYQFTVQFRPGRGNENADALSRSNFDRATNELDAREEGGSVRD